MFNPNKWMWVWIVGFLVVLPVTVQCQEVEEAEAKKDIQVSHVFSGETITAPPEEADALEVILQSIEVMGGKDNYKTLQDLKYRFFQKCYQDGKYVFNESATGYNVIGDRLKSRLDFDYVQKTNTEKKIDYREVLGDDGAFKYLDGRILRGIKDVKDAADRISMLNLYVLTPFHLNLDEAEPTLTGISTWTEDGEGEEVTHKCYKVLLLVPDKYSRVRKKLVSLMIDVETKRLKRIIYQTRQNDPSRDRLKIIDILERTSISGIQFPTKMTSTEYTEIADRTEVTFRKIQFSDFQTKSGLQGVGFEVVEQ